MTKRLRILAGPNGSGKTSVYNALIAQNVVHWGIFVNADLIESSLRSERSISFDSFEIKVNEKAFIEGYESFFEEQKTSISVDDFIIDNNQIIIKTSEREVDSYFASYVASYIRVEMIDKGVPTVTIETVMSHPSKLEFIKFAKEKGYRVYLYYVSTKDSAINVERVEARVKQNGHGVSLKKIKDRYERSMDMLYDAMVLCDRAYLFDNSSTNFNFFAEYTGGEETLKLKRTSPRWVIPYVLEKIK